MLKSLCLSLVVLSLSLSVAAAEETLNNGNTSVIDQLKKLLADEKAAQATFDTDKSAYEATLPAFKQAEAAVNYAKVVRENREKDLKALTSDVTTADTNLAAAEVALKAASDALDAAKSAATTPNKYDDPAVRAADEEYVLKSREREQAFAARESADIASAQVTLRLETEFALRLRSPRKPSLVEVLRQEVKVAQTAETKANNDLVAPKKLHDEAKVKAEASKAALEAIQKLIREAASVGNGAATRNEIEKLRRTTDVQVGAVAAEVKTLRTTTDTRLSQLAKEMAGVKTEVSNVKVEVSNLSSTLDARLLSLATTLKPVTVEYEWRCDSYGNRRRVKCN